MSTDSTTPSTPGSTAVGTTSETELITSQPEGAVPEAEREPGWITRHTALLTAVLAAVIVAAVAVTGLVWYRDAQGDRNAETEAAFAETVATQGATLETVECDGDTCAAVVAGQAYTVLVQEDEDGKQHFGVSAFVGD